MDINLLNPGNVIFIAPTVITTPLVTGLTAGNIYRLEIKFVTGGNTLEAYAIIQAEK